MSLLNSLKTLGLTAGLLLGASAQAMVIEDFEIGNCDDQGAYPAAWTVAQAGFDFVNTAGAQAGNCGVIADSGWYYRTDFSTGENSILSAWFRTGEGDGQLANDGRFYLGFGADASGASSFVAAPNTGDIRFQNNPGYDFDELNSVAQVFEAQKWYRLQVVFLPGGDILGGLYDSDGTTLLNSLVASGVTSSVGGIALRGFEVAYDTVEFLAGTPPTDVPVPATLALFGIALTGMGLFARKRRQ